MSLEPTIKLLSNRKPPTNLRSLKISVTVKKQRLEKACDRSGTAKHLQQLQLQMLLEVKTARQYFIVFIDGIYPMV